MSFARVSLTSPGAEGLGERRNSEGMPSTIHPSLRPARRGRQLALPGQLEHSGRGEGAPKGRRLRAHGIQVAWTVGACLTGHPPDPHRRGTMAHLESSRAVRRRSRSAENWTWRRRLSWMSRSDRTWSGAGRSSGRVRPDVRGLVRDRAIVRSAHALTPGCLVLHGVREQVARAIDVMGLGRGVSNLHVMPCLVGGEPSVRD